MSAGGVFKLIANDGKADRMLMATELLNQRIKDIMCAKARMGVPDPTPTLVEIERTHIIFVNAHFKPFAAIAYEYQKTKNTAGNQNFGSTSLQFSIPQFGDFFNDMVVSVSISAASAGGAVAGDIPAFPAAIGNADIAATGLLSTSAIVAAAGNYIRYTYNYVTLNNTILNRTADAVQNFVRYVEYPGQRLFKKVRFDVNGNPLDEYNADTVVMFQKFRVAPGKLVGWQRLMGQEVPINAYSELCTISGTSIYPTFSVGLNAFGTTTPSVAAPVNAVQTTRKLAQIVNGLQTPQATQPAANLYIPLLFWFNRDTRLSVPSVSIPYGQRFITLDIEELQNIIYTAPGNLFLQLTTESFLCNNAAGFAAAADTITNYNRVVTRRAVLVPTSTVGGGAGNVAPQITNMELYINNIFMNPEIHDIYIKRIGFSLIRVHRIQNTPVKDQSSDFLLSQLKWPTEVIYAGARPDFNTANPVYNGLNVVSGNPNVWRDWHRFSRLVDRTCDSAARAQVLLGGTTAVNTFVAGNPVTIAEIAGTDGNGGTRQESLIQLERLTYTQSVPTINTLSVKAHAIKIYDTYAREFFNQYLPFTYGGWNIVTPDDDGVMMVNFCLYPGTYQPSGHINISRAREFYFEYTSSYFGVVDTNTPFTSVTAASGVFVSIAIALNFLLISDGKNNILCR